MFESASLASQLAKLRKSSECINTNEDTQKIL